MHECQWHLCTKEIEDGKNFCSSKCYNRAKVTKRRRKLKVMAVNHKGGKCEVCEYAKCVAALEFHHQDPSQKEFRISSGITRAWSTIEKELDKCVLLCSNCHKETHAEWNKNIV